MKKEYLQKQIEARYKTLKPVLNERSRRIWAAAEAKAIGWGGQILVARATGIHKNTVFAGMKEIQSESIETNRIRVVGGGRKNTITKDKTLREDIKKQVESSTLGDPESPLLWSSKSTRKIAREINREQKRVSYVTVAKELQLMGYSLQANRKTQEGGNHPDRDAQFNFINEKTKDLQKRNQPVISVDTKKKELIGNFKNNGKEYHKKGQAPEVNVYDFLEKEKGKVSPYGVYDLDKNKGWVSVGVSSDTAEFAVNSIGSWWYAMGKETYPEATEIYINADGGGSNGSRCKLWKWELQKLANEVKIPIHVSHFPPGTSKWNKIEHRMFSFISKNWRGKPLIDRATVVNLIGNTTTTRGLRIKAMLDENEYQKGRKITDREFAQIILHRDEFHGEWNYVIFPNKS